MKRPADDFAYVWVTEVAQWDEFRRAASIAGVSDFHPARQVYRAIFEFGQGERAADLHIAEFFGFDDYESIPREYVVGFIEEVKKLWAPVAGDEPPPGWHEC